MNVSDCLGAIERLAARLQLTFGRGRIRTADDSGGVQFVQVELGADEIRNKTPRLAEFGFSSMPPNGSDAFVAFFMGDRSKGVVIGTGHQASRPKGLLPGESMLYSQDGKYVKLTAAGGIVVEAKGQDVVVNNAANVTVNASTKVTLVAPNVEIDAATKLKIVSPLVEMTGNLTVSGDATVNGVSSKHHVHGGVTAGAANTGQPV